MYMNNKLSLGSNFIALSLTLLSFIFSLSILLFFPISLSSLVSDQWGKDQLAKESRSNNIICEEGKRSNCSLLLRIS